MPSPAPAAVELMRQAKEEMIRDAGVGAEGNNAFGGLTPGHAINLARLGVVSQIGGRGGGPRVHGQVLLGILVVKHGGADFAVSLQEGTYRLG